MINFILGGGYIMFVLFAVGLPLVAVAAKFARDATPQRLSLVRALSAALACTGVAGVASDLMMVARHLAGEPDWLKDPLPVLLAGFAESMAPAIAAAALAAIAWILIAFGVRRMPAEGQRD